MTNSVISVIVPVYNMERYLQECVDSIVNQTYRNLEILLVNDGSKDGSLALLNAYAQKDQRVKVLDKPNGGLSDARNYGLNYATGEFVLFIDSDDAIDVTMCEKLMLKQEEADYDIVVCDMEYVYDDGRREFSSGGDFYGGSISDHPEYILLNNSACNKLFKRSLWKEIRFPKGMYYEDLATIPMVMFDAKSIGKVNKSLYWYRQRSGSISHTASMKVFDIYDAIKRVYEYIDQEGCNTDVYQYMNHLYILHGLDLTTLRIKDFDDKQIRESYLVENMKRLKEYYPNYKKDSYLKSYGFKKRMIFKLLELGKMKWVLKIYDK